MPGRLYLVPNLLGIVPAHDVLPRRTIEIARALRHFVVENAKPARQFLKALEVETPIRQLDIVEIGDQPSARRCADLLAPLHAGSDLGLMTDAGCPGVADPGAALVAAAHHHRIAVAPLVARPPVRLPWMPSGLTDRAFTFQAYFRINPAHPTDPIRVV